MRVTHLRGGCALRRAAPGSALDGGPWTQNPSAPQAGRSLFLAHLVEVPRSPYGTKREFSQGHF